GHAASFASSHHCAFAKCAQKCSSGTPSDGSGSNNALANRVHGTSTKLMNGTATRFASGPTSDAWPKNHTVNGNNATAINNGDKPISRNLPRQPCPRASAHASSTTPAKDSQNPADNTDSGSTRRTAQSARPRPSPRPSPRRAMRASDTAPIIQSVRVVGRPKPASAP